MIADDFITPKVTFIKPLTILGYRTSTKISQYLPLSVFHLIRLI